MFGMKYLFYLCVVGLVNADEIVVNKPIQNDLINQKNVEIGVSIVRNGMLYIKNVTADLMTKNGEIVKSVFVDTSVGTSYNFVIESDVQQGQTKEYDLNIVGYGRFLSVQSSSNGTIEEIIKYMNKEFKIAIKIDLSNSGGVQTTQSPTTSVLGPKETTVKTPQREPYSSALRNVVNEIIYVICLVIPLL